jgi:hypothetical protein
VNIIPFFRGETQQAICNNRKTRFHCGTFLFSVWVFEFFDRIYRIDRIGGIYAFICIAALIFVGQDSRTSVTHPLAHPSDRLRRGSLRKAFAFLRCIFARLALLIVRRFLYDVAPSAISSAELRLAYAVSISSDPLILLL